MSQLVNLTLDNTSPEIRFRGAWWSIGDTDPFYEQFYDKTYLKTSDSGNFMGFTWSGGNVWVYGSKRPNHGYYSVFFDGDTNSKQYFDGYSPTDQARQLIMSTSDLAIGQHQFRITNENQHEPFYSDDPKLNRTDLDIDYLIIEMDPSVVASHTTSSAQEEPKLAPSTTTATVVALVTPSSKLTSSIMPSSSEPLPSSSGSSSSSSSSVAQSSSTTHSVAVAGSWAAHGGKTFTTFEWGSATPVLTHEPAPTSIILSGSTTHQCVPGGFQGLLFAILGLCWIIRSACIT